MLARRIKNEIGQELILCNSPRDVRRVFEAAEKDFHVNNVPAHRRREVLMEVRKDIKILINRSSDPNSGALVVEAQITIDRLLGEVP